MNIFKLLKPKTKKQLFKDFSKKYNINTNDLERFISRYRFFHKPDINTTIVKNILYAFLLIVAIIFIAFLFMGGWIFEFYDLPSRYDINSIYDPIPEPDGYKYKLLLNITAYVIQATTVIVMFFIGIFGLIENDKK